MTSVRCPPSRVILCRDNLNGALGWRLDFANSRQLNTRSRQSLAQRCCQLRCRLRTGTFAGAVVWRCAFSVASSWTIWA